jgi:hypothetical protein
MSRLRKKRRGLTRCLDVESKREGGLEIGIAEMAMTSASSKDKLSTNLNVRGLIQR